MWGEPQVTRARVDRTGRADHDLPQIRERQPGGLAGGRQARQEAADDLVRRAPRGHRVAVFGQGLAGHVGDHDVHAAGRQVDRGDVRDGPVDGPELGAGATSTAAQSLPDDDTFVLQPGQQLRGRGLGQADRVLELRTREGAVAQQRVDGRAIVDLTQQPRASGSQLGSPGRIGSN
jgi:hypothetical protein